MKYVLLFMLLYTFSLSKENIVISNHQKLFIKALNSEIISFQSPNTNFITLGIFTKTELGNQNKEKIYKTMINLFSEIIKEYNIENKRGVAFLIINNSKQNPVLGNIALFLSEKYLKKISNRKFDNAEEDKIFNDSFTREPPYPLKELFKNGIIYETTLTQNGLIMKKSNQETNLFKIYLSNKHSFNDYFTETKLDEIYVEYQNFRKDKVFSCAVVGNIKCIEKYIRYGLNINKKDNENHQTLLEYASANGHYQIIKLLINNGADPNIHKKGFENAYLTAKRRGYTKIAKLLKPITNMTEYPSYSSSKYSSYDLKNMCLGASGKYPSFCYKINNTNLKNSCLAIKQYPSFSDKINNSDLNKFTLGVNGQNPSSCYQINNNDLKNACLGINKTAANCYNIKDKNMQKMCLGISKDSNFCYSIK